MATAAMVMGLAAWWGCACRIGQMQWRTHRSRALLGYVGLSAMAISSAMAGLFAVAEPLAAAASAAICTYLLITLGDWQFGPPERTWRRTIA